MPKRKRAVKKKAKPSRKRRVVNSVPRTVKKKSKPGKAKTAAFHKSIAKKKYEKRLGELMVRQFKTVKKSAKRKIGKTISAVKSQIKKLS